MRRAPRGLNVQSGPSEPCFMESCSLATTVEVGVSWAGVIGCAEKGHPGSIGPSRFCDTHACDRSLRWKGSQPRLRPTHGEAKETKRHADFCQCGLHALYACRLRSVCAACRVLMSVCVLRALRVHAEPCQCVHADFRQCMLHALRVHAGSCQCVQVHVDFCQCERQRDQAT